MSGYVQRAMRLGATPTLGKEGVLTAFYGNPRQFYFTVGLKF